MIVMDDDSANRISVFIVNSAKAAVDQPELQVTGGADPRIVRTNNVFEINGLGRGRVTLNAGAPGYESQTVTLEVRGGYQQVVLGLPRPGELTYRQGDSQFAFSPVRDAFLLHALGTDAEGLVESALAHAGLKVRQNPENLRFDDSRSAWNMITPSSGNAVVAIVDAPPERSSDLVKGLAAKNVTAKAALIIQHRDEKAIGLAGELIVRFQSDVDLDQVRALATKHGLTILREVKHAGNAYLLQYPGALTYEVLNVAYAIQLDARVVYAEPNLIFQIQPDQYIPSDPLWVSLPHLALVRCPHAWDRLDDVALALRGGSPNITIAIVDTQGVAPDHPDLTSNVTDQAPKTIINIDFSVNPIQLQTVAGLQGNHGTECAGSATAAFDNGRGIVGVAPNCHLIGAQAPGITDAVQMADMYLWVAGFLNGSTTPGFPRFPPPRAADVISSSFGSNGLALSNTMRECFDFLATYGRGGRGCVICFSLGNNGYVDFTDPTGSKFRAWPSYEKTIAIGSSINTNPTNPILESYYADPSGNKFNIATQVDVRTLYSPYGNTVLRKPDLVAPSHTAYKPDGSLIDPVMACQRVGQGKTNGCTGGVVCNDYGLEFGGTSHSTPTVAGAIALILSARPDLSWIQVRELLWRSAARIDGNNADAAGQWQDLDGDGIIDYSRWYGAGRLDVDRALTLALDPALQLADIYVRENFEDSGDVPSPGSHLQSPDIWVRSTDDPIPTLAWNDLPPHENPVRGRDNFVFCRVRNRGAVTASTVFVRAMITHYPGFEYRYPHDFRPTVRVGGASPSPLALGTYLIGEVRLNNLAAGDARIVKMRWPQALIPPATVNFGIVDAQWNPCLLLEASPHDGPIPPRGAIAVRADNNIAQRAITIDDPRRRRFVAMIAGTYDDSGIRSLIIDTSRLEDDLAVILGFADPALMRRFNSESMLACRKVNGEKSPLPSEIRALGHSRLLIGSGGDLVEVELGEGMAIRMHRDRPMRGVLKVTTVKHEDADALEFRGYRGPIEIPFRLERGHMAPLFAALLGSGAGELWMTQRRGDGQVSPGYLIAQS